jgi:glycosyltransferase involved in cell wall biosynthesis
MKRLLFDGLATQGTSKIQFHGGGEYAKYILRKAIEAGYRNFDVVFSNKMLIDKNIKDLVENTEGIEIFYIDSRDAVYDLIKIKKYDCFFSALAILYTNYSLETLFIMVIHGLRSIELTWDDKRWQYYSNIFMRSIACIISKSGWLQNLLRKNHIKGFSTLLSVKNKKIITVSEHSKYALLYYFPYLNLENINVWYSPNYELGNIADNPSASDNTYFLMISANRWEKNICRAVEAFDTLFTHNQLGDKRVVIAGSSSNCYFLKKIRNKDRFQLLPYLSETELECLYKKAFALVFPSLNEGFGIPPLYAMKYGIPVIASSATSIPEVCGSGAVYFDPHSIDDLANRILQVTYNHGLYASLVAGGYQQYKQYQQYQQPEMIKEIFGSDINV